jgi:hypothetical protein
MLPISAVNNAATDLPEFLMSGMHNAAAGNISAVNNAASPLPEVQGKAVEGPGSPAAACKSAFFSLQYV